MLTEKQSMTRIVCDELAKITWKSPSDIFFRRLTVLRDLSEKWQQTDLNLPIGKTATLPGPKLSSNTSVVIKKERSTDEGSSRAATVKQTVCTRSQSGRRRTCDRRKAQVPNDSACELSDNGSENNGVCNSQSDHVSKMSRDNSLEKIEG